MGSSRFYGKPLAEINGKPMVKHVYDAVVDCAWVDGVCVAAAEYHIIHSCFERSVPSVFTGVHATGTDRCYDAAQRLGIKRGIVLNVQGDEPLIQHHHIKAVVDLFDIPRVQVATLVYESDGGDKDDVKVQFDSTGKIFNFTRLGGYTPKYYHNIGIMGFRLGVLADFARLGQSEREKQENIELMRCLDNNIPVHCAITDTPTIGVDRKGDIKRVEDEINRRSMCN
jgi:3-deoxy-manno-octulosonate cytidylyltransferase (CMP-KDO synthetase)